MWFSILVALRVVVVVQSSSSKTTTTTTTTRASLARSKDFFSQFVGTGKKNPIFIHLDIYIFFIQMFRVFLLEKKKKPVPFVVITTTFRRSLLRVRYQQHTKDSHKRQQQRDDGRRALFVGIRLGFIILSSLEPRGDDGMEDTSRDSASHSPPKAGKTRWRLSRRSGQSGDVRGRTGVSPKRVTGKNRRFAEKSPKEVEEAEEAEVRSRSRAFSFGFDFRITR